MSILRVTQVLAALLAVLLVAGVLVARTAAQNWIDSQPPCGNWPHIVRPAAVHLVPSLDEHQSWVDFPIAERLTRAEFCVDGRSLERDPGEIANGVIRYGVRTRWVDLLWAGAALPAYHDPSRWELRY